MKKNTLASSLTEKILDHMLTKTHSKNLMPARLLRQVKNLETQKIQMKIQKVHQQKSFAQG